MKKIVMLLAILLVGTVSFAQEVHKPTYEQKGDLIEATLYHDNGVVAQTGYYTQDNKLEGEWISYDTHGIKTAEAYYSNGEKVGTWTFYNGDTKKEVTYDNSRITAVKTWEVTDTRVVTN
ncbi:nicotinic acid mononucleotide adenyltransferase [Aureisphaera galaxeae]|uniref:toxin-antitoxin system YwqK family antitoxin n=1 Tax=Aureisphaera galaxeae TaxID=1538023 RepID=UPI0023504162|nr:nicotinic acid mononucleotide adenyltransferase [Aureisphaera galaxeae]MDC8005949.1 nicotinic acid mononucleotide adenyltransferase [Aureisphaera galaxeae]